MRMASTNKALFSYMGVDSGDAGWGDLKSYLDCQPPRPGLLHVHVPPSPSPWSFYRQLTEEDTSMLASIFVFLYTGDNAFLRSGKGRTRRIAKARGRGGVGVW